MDRLAVQWIWCSRSFGIVSPKFNKGFLCHDVWVLKWMLAKILTFFLLMTGACLGFVNIELGERSTKNIETSIIGVQKRNWTARLQGLQKIGPLVQALASTKEMSVAKAVMQLVRDNVVTSRTWPTTRHK